MLLCLFPVAATDARTSPHGLLASLFRDAVERAQGGNYQTLINNALRAYIEGAQKPTIEETLRRVIREELRTAP